MAMFVSCHPAQIYDCFAGFSYRNIDILVYRQFKIDLCKRKSRGNFHLKLQNI